MATKNERTGTIQKTEKVISEWVRHRRILSAVLSGYQTVKDLAERTGLTTQQVEASVLVLTVNGFVELPPDGAYSATAAGRKIGEELGL
jgi:Mn-dependent DtxR family transcriptional regulator